MTYNNASLKSDTQSWLENNSAEITANLQTICNMAMQTISKDLRVRCLNFTDTSINFSSGEATYAIPNNSTLLSLREFSFQWDGSGSRYVPLLKRTITFVDEYWQDRSVAGSLTKPPKYYAIEDDANFVVVPTPYKTMATKVKGRAQLAQLSGDTDTNYIITNHYDFALTACLLEASRFIIDDRQEGLISLNSARYNQLRDLINAMEMRIDRDEMERPTIDAVNAPSAGQQPETR